MNTLVRICLFIFYSANVFAQNPAAARENPAAPTEKPAEAKKPVPSKTEMYDQLDAQLPSQNETWYTQWGLGLSSNKYDPDTTASLAGWNRTQVAIDILGFYWPMAGHQTMQGFIICGQGDSYRSPSGLTEYSISSSLYAYSIQHFFGANIGDGWLLRADVGLAKASESITGSGYTISGVSDTGFGYDLGGGYAWPTSSETRFLLTGLLTSKKIKGTSGDVNLNSFSLLASLLF